jgi:hypothetical protein
MKNALPSMHGSWSIWLASTLMGIINYFNPYGVALSFLLLLSIQPLHRFLKEGVASPMLAFPALFTITAIGIAIRDDEVLLVLVPYALLFMLQFLVRSHLRVYIILGAMVLTFPFPMIAAMSDESIGNFLHLWIPLVLISLYSVLLADTIIFENGKNWNLWSLISTRRVLIVLIILSMAMYELLPLRVFLPVIGLAIFITLMAGRISVKRLGLSLLFFQLFFALLSYFS